MNGTVLKRGDTWTVVIELARDPVTGRRRQKWHGGFRTKKEAERARVQFLGKVLDGSYVEQTRQTLRTHLDEWLKAIEPTVRPATFHSYERNLRLHVLPHLGHTRLQQIDPGTLNGLYAHLLTEGKASGAGGLSPRSVIYVHTILHRALKDAVRWGRLARNPGDAADPPKADKAASKNINAWEASTLNSFLGKSKASRDRYYPAWHLLATTGLRRGEALGLRWSDLDLDTGTASIRQTVIAVNHAVEFGTPKTAKGRRQIALDAGTVRALRDHRVSQLEERMLIGEGWDDHDLVSANVHGGPLHPERFSREFDRRIQRWGLPRIRLHDLRHTWATLALQAGVHPKVVSERLGHSTISITLDTYSHVTPSMASDAADLVAELIRLG